jgi:hypothetical protein
VLTCGPFSRLCARPVALTRKETLAKSKAPTKKKATKSI